MLLKGIKNHALTAKENKELFNKLSLAKESEKQSIREEIILGNIGLTIEPAKRYAAVSHSLTEEDLIIEGVTGIMHAVWHFDNSLGVFSSYAMFWIKQSMRRAMDNQDRAIRIPASGINVLYRIDKLQSVCEQTGNPRYTLCELSQILDISEARLEVLLRTNEKPLSLDSPAFLSGDDNAELKDIISNEDEMLPDEEAEISIMNNTINNTFKILTEREQKVLKMRFGFNEYNCHTLDEIAGTCGVTRERIRQIEANALQKLRRHICISKDISYEFLSGYSGKNANVI